MLTEILAAGRRSYSTGPRKAADWICVMWMLKRTAFSVVFIRYSRYPDPILLSRSYPRLRVFQSSEVRVIRLACRKASRAS
jgi:hypothetical protein